MVSLCLRHAQLLEPATISVSRFDNTSTERDISPPAAALDILVDFLREW